MRIVVFSTSFAVTLALFSGATFPHCDSALAARDMGIEEVEHALEIENDSERRVTTEIDANS